MRRKISMMVVLTIVLAFVMVTGMPSSTTAGTNVQIYSYAAKFVCQESLAPGTLSFSPTPPIVEQKTEVLVHNPQGANLYVYKKAVESRLAGIGPPAPGGKLRVLLSPDRSFRINCDEIAALLQNVSVTTGLFRTSYGTGVVKEGFVVIQTDKQIDVTAEYTRGSEVLKKDVNYQPWWWYWITPLPWGRGSGNGPRKYGIGYPLQLVVPVQGDCREAAVRELQNQVNASGMNPTEKSLTNQALDRGLDADNPADLNPPNPPDNVNDASLFTLIGKCDKIDASAMAIDLVVAGNLTPGAAVALYPWRVGGWYDLVMVVPNNHNLDLDNYIRSKLATDWRAVSTIDSDTTISSYMNYFFPYWCGWGYWWYWWNGSNCTSIGVGEGESLDVEQVVASRPVCARFPPLDNDNDGRYDEGGADAEEC